MTSKRLLSPRLRRPGGKGVIKVETGVQNRLAFFEMTIDYSPVDATVEGSLCEMYSAWEDERWMESEGGEGSTSSCDAVDDKKYDDVYCLMAKRASRMKSVTSDHLTTLTRDGCNDDES